MPHRSQTGAITTKIVRYRISITYQSARPEEFEYLAGRRSDTHRREADPDYYAAALLRQALEPVHAGVQRPEGLCLLGHLPTQAPHRFEELTQQHFVSLTALMVEAKVGAAIKVFWSHP
jgi:hypothetical protein